MRRDAARALDEYLVLSAQTGAPRAFAMLAARWQPKLLRHAGRLLGDAEAARDVVQEAWLDIARGLNRLEDPAAYPAWAMRIVSRRAADAIRGRQRNRRLGVALAAEPDPAAAAPFAEATVRLALARAVAALPVDQRAAVSLFYLEDMSVAEIAMAMETPVGTVKTRLLHARRKLRAALSSLREGESL